ncbi:MAG: hypothetical protein ABI080_21540, partial [Candidatus Binatia bacterium]
MILKGAIGTLDRGYIHGGDIGVNFPGRGQDGSPSLSYATSGRLMMDPNSNAVADSVRASNPEGVFFNLFANSVNANFNPTILGAGPLPFTPPIIAANALPTLPFTPGRALTDGANDVLVGGAGFPSPHALAPGAYRDVRVNDGGTLNLADGLYDLRSFSLGTNVTVNVTDHTTMQIDRQWSINDGLKFGVGTFAGARVYVGALGFDANQLTVCNFAHLSEIHMRFFSPTGWLDLGGMNKLYGRFWARRITGDPSNDVVRQDPPSVDPPGDDDERRFQCYEIHRPVFDLADVSVVDAIGASTVTIKRAKRICAPADVDGVDPTAPLDPGHLTYYTIRQTSPFSAATATVTNELGTAVVKVAKPDRMLVPTAKSLVALPGPLASPIDHFKCYRLSTARTRASGLAITDQFGAIVVDVKKPLHLCLAASTDGAPVPNPGASLMCYQVRGSRPAAPPPIIFTHDMFGPDQYGFFGPRDLCFPSTVEFH